MNSLKIEKFCWALVLSLVASLPSTGASADACRNHEAHSSSGGVRAKQGWSDYQVIIWQHQTPARLAGFQRLGVTAGVIIGQRGEVDREKIAEEAAPFLSQHMRCYVENIATDFYSAYHRWYRDRPVNWLFDEAKHRYERAPADSANFIRTPSLSDPFWLRRIVRRLRQHVCAFARYRPLFYSLADEAGVADLAAAWDFDFAPASLAGMRLWLKTRYHTLAALNWEWGTRFLTWRKVVPMTTDQALKRRDDNFAAWNDFKEWMDVAFARSVRVGTNAVHAADPTARAALEGAQIPGWGGYNYDYLASAVDVMEIYDIGNNVEIARSIAPGLITLTTAMLSGPLDVRAVWHELLLGGRGLILWDADNGFVDDNGVPTARGERLSALTTELRSGVAAQLINSVPVADPVAILYSPVSQRIQWLLDRKSDAKPWAERDAENEYEGNPVRAAARRAAHTLVHLGIQPRWFTSDMIIRGALRADRIRVLVLPHTIALSAAEARQIYRFVAHGGVLLADSQPGQFDAHGRRLPSPRLRDVALPGSNVRLMPQLWQGTTLDDPTKLAQLRQALEASGIRPPFLLSEPSGATVVDVDARVFQNGDATIIGLQRDGTNNGDKAVEDVVIDFAKPVYAFDLRHPGAPQHASQLRLALDRTEPALIAFSPKLFAPLTIKAPAQARLGNVAIFDFSRSGQGPKATRVVHVEATAPDGENMSADATNLMVGQSPVQWSLPLRLNDPVGDWRIRIADVLSGEKFEITLPVINASAQQPIGQPARPLEP